MTISTSLLAFSISRLSYSLLKFNMYLFFVDIQFVHIIWFHLIIFIGLLIFSSKFTDYLQLFCTEATYMINQSSQKYAKYGAVRSTTFNSTLQFYNIALQYWLYSFNSLGPSDAIWRWRSWSTLVQVMACCLTAPSHYLNLCWLVISKVLWNSSEGTIIRRYEDINQ